jgi:4-hydroxy-3-polyprenylbenzoate decarboxylase
VKTAASASTEHRRQRLLVGISGASGAVYGIRLLEVLSKLDQIETHLIITPAARRTIVLETDWAVSEVEGLATVNHRYSDIAAAPASGSFRMEAMIIVPCSMGTLAHVAHSFSDNLLDRAADVALKERRRLVLAPRETPLHLGHLRLLVQVAEIGAIIAPPMPAFYHHPKSVDDLINQSVNRLLDLLDIPLPVDLFERWQGGPHRRSRLRPEATRVPISDNGASPTAASTEATPSRGGF